MSGHSRKLAWAAAGVFAVGAASGWVAPTFFHTAQAAESAASTAAPGPIALTTAPNYRAIVAQNEAAVVGVSIEGRVKVSDSQQQMPDLGQLFGFDPFGNRGGPRGPNRIPMHGQGSGFIVSPDGLVLTNAHVVKDADQVTVKLLDHREFKAKVLGADTTSDIAVLKIEAHGLTPVRLGNSDQLSVGDNVLAIVLRSDSKRRRRPASSAPRDARCPAMARCRSYRPSDAAVNPGNSGGPLFDSSGAVVGINSQIYTNSGGYQGVAFAIPINLAVQVKDQIVKNGKVEHGRLGVEVQTLDQALADSFHLSSPAGALVAKVEPDGAAAHAGVKPGDVILKYNGAAVDDSGQLSSRVSMTAPGEHVPLEISRDGKVLTLTVTIGWARQLTADESSHGDGDQSHLGLSVRPLTPDEREQVGTSGLLVEDAEGRAAAAGIQQGDVVLSVNGTPVRSVAELRALVHGRDHQVALLIQRGDSRIFVPVALG